MLAEMFNIVVQCASFSNLVIMFKPEQKLNPESFIQSTHLTTYVLNLNFIEEQKLNLNQFED